MFITEYMLRAPGNYVKVYLYALMFCYHPSGTMSVESMARDMEMDEQEVIDAFNYWQRNGLVRQVGDNPITYKFSNVKQMTLTRAENPAEQLYDKEFASEIERRMEGRILSPNDYQTIYDWVDVLDLPKEVVLMLLQNEMDQCKKSGHNFSFFVADQHAKQWAQSGVRTIEDVDRIVIIGKQREDELRRLLARLGQRRAPSDDETALYQKWLEDWGFTPEAVQEACRETTKGTPTMAYLDGILLRQHQLGRHEAAQLEAGMQREHTARDFAREVYAKLGRTGITPTPDDLAAIQAWREQGADDELILLAVTAAHRRAGGGNMDDVDAYLTRWRERGLTTAEAVRADSARTRALNAQLREIYDAAGLEKRPNAPDRDLLCRWAGPMHMSQELILQAAEYARGMGAPMLAMGRILESWSRMNITIPAEARREHEDHVRGGGQPARFAPASGYNGAGGFQRYTPEEQRRIYSSAVVDFDEEDDE